MGESREARIDFTSFVGSIAATAAATLNHVEALLQPGGGGGGGEEPHAATPEVEAASGAGSHETESAAPSPQEIAKQVRNALASARQLIDTLVMLEEKTKGNLTDDEKQLLQAALTELRFGYVRLEDRSSGGASSS